MNKFLKNIRSELIKIPFFCKMGNFRRQLLELFKKNEKEEVTIDAVKSIYEHGNNNSDHRYFIIYADMPKGGLFVYLISCMSQIAHAINKGYIPVVDLLNFPSDLRNSEDENAWELYFEQPAGVRVQEVYGAHNVVFHGEEKEQELYIGDVDSKQTYSNYNVVIDESKEFKEWYQNEELMERFQTFWKTNIRYNSYVKEYIDDKYREMIGEDQHVLGLLCRGTDYISLHPPGHYVQPSVEQIIIKVQEIVEKYDCSKIFLATEDADILKQLKHKFGEKLVYLDVPRVNYYDGIQLSDLYKKQKMDLFRRQLNYLTEMEVLARLPYLIAGKTTGSRFIPVMKAGKFEYLFFWELGRY